LESQATGWGFVFWDAGLYSNAILQPFLIAVLICGWWYWLRGEDSRRPRIKSTNLWIVGATCAAALPLASAAAFALEIHIDANMALGDASILALSVVTQILLSRKRIENWHVWILINAISVYVYASQALWLYTALYVFFFFNAFWGWWEWRMELRGYESGA